MPENPTFEVESGLHAAGVRHVVAVDEVGRGAIAGPVAVGMAVVDGACGPWPTGLRDSKLLSGARREKLAPLCRRWALHHAVGLSSAQEIDSLGITAALGLAGRRALAALVREGFDPGSATVLLDGTVDWLGPALEAPAPIITRARADRDCASVAAASVIAKVHRDALMVARDAVTPGYSWAANKGYASKAHREAILRLGPSDFHRHTWLHLDGWGDIDLKSHG